MKKKSNRLFKKPALYFVADPGVLKEGTLAAAVRKAVKGGADLVQLRDKQSCGKTFLENAKKLSSLLNGGGVPFIVNDRVDIALACGADGVHLGQNDMPVADARRLMGKKAIIGASCHTVAQARRAQSEGADYIGAGQIYHTTTKGITRHPIGIRGYAAIRKAVSIPVIAIGGIKTDNATELVEAGCDGIAVVTGIMWAKDPVKTARLFKKILSGSYAGDGHEPAGEN